MVAHFFRHDDIAHVQRSGQATGGTGIDHHIGLALFQQQGGTQSRRHFADARFEQGDFHAVNLAGIDLTTRTLQGLAVRNLLAQQGNFFFHCADDAYFHK
ncbi:hypothetical protein D3C80_1413480 [compost metagenome]